MLKYSVDFDRICNNISSWTWTELKFGYDKKIITNNDLITYAVMTLTEGMNQFNNVLELSISDEYEVDEKILNLAYNEEGQKLENIISKWIFAIIYDMYTYSTDNIYNVIENLYIDFEYPKELSNLISYMPRNDGKTIEENLNLYIQLGENKWIKSPE